MPDCYWPGRRSTGPHPDQRGSTLILAVLFSLIVSAIGGTMIMMSNADHRIAANERDAERALFAARAGPSFRIESTITRDIFANEVKNDGSIQGSVKPLSSVSELSSSAPTWDRVDAFGAKYSWLNGNSSPGSFNGAELAWKIHNCDYFWFTYDPLVRCTRFLLTSDGTPEIVSYREVR